MAGIYGGWLSPEGQLYTAKDKMQHEQLGQDILKEKGEKLPPNQYYTQYLLGQGYVRLVVFGPKLSVHFMRGLTDIQTKMLLNLFKRWGIQFCSRK